MNGARTWLCGAVFLCAAAAALGQATVPPDLERAKKIVSRSRFLRHGADGDAGTELFPKLAAQHPEYIAKQLANFKSGARKSATMSRMVIDLSEADFAALGVYFNRKPPTAHDDVDAALAAAGKTLYFGGNLANGVFACATCHGDDAAGSSVLPRLAGQHPGYRGAAQGVPRPRAHERQRGDEGDHAQDDRARDQGGERVSCGSEVIRAAGRLP